MKKSILSILTLALVAVGCQNYDDQFDSLNKDIAALTTKVNAIDSGLASQITSVANSVSALATQLTTIGNAALTTADLTTALAGVLADIADTQAALTALDADVATDVAGVQTTVNDLVTQLVATDGAIADIAADVIANGTGVAANGTAIATNGTNIETNGTNIETNGTNIEANGATATANGTAIATNGTNIEANGTAVADVDADLVLTNAEIAAILTLLQEVSDSALTDADVAALAEVANLNAEMDALQAGLDELLAAQASVQGINIVNQATLDYVETLMETDGTPANYIVNGDVNIDASVAANYSTGYIAAINELTKLVASVIGNVTITTADTDAALSIEQLTYVSGSAKFVGKMPSGFIIGTAGSLTLDVDEADITLTSLTSSAGGVLLQNTAGTTTLTNVAIANLTNGAITTDALGGTVLSLANADVNLGAGHPAATTTAKSLIAGNATDALSGATLTITNDLTLGSKVVTNTTIDAGGAVTLSNGDAASSVGSSTITSGGDINIAALTLGAAGASALNITCDGASGGITLGATSSGASFTATASGSTINAASYADNGAGTVTFAGTSVNISGMTSNTGALVVNTATSIDLPLLASSGGTITAADATSFSAPLLTTAANVDLAAGATVAVKALTALGNIVDIATITKLTLTEQETDLVLSTAVHMTELNYTPKAMSVASSEDTDLTYSVLTSASSLTTVNLGAGGYGDVIIKAPLVTSLTTAGDMRTFTTTGTALTNLTIGHQGINGGAVSQLSVTDTGITGLDISALKWLGTLTVTGNSSLTTVQMPTATAASDNVNVTVAGGGVNVTITGNAITGTWTDAIAAGPSQIYVEGSLSGVGITNAKAWLTALEGNVNLAVASVTYSIGVDGAVTAMIANNGVSTVMAASITGFVSDTASLALLP